MPYRDPRCVFVAEKIGEADVVATWLGQHDIKAEVMDRNTRGGFEGLSMVTPNGVSSRGIEVWVIDPEQVPQAIQMLAEQEMQRTTRDAAQEASGEPIDVTCEDCGTTTTFPPTQRGSVQDCPNCAAYLDVGEEEELEMAEDDSAAEAEDESESPDGIRLPPHVRPDSD